MKICLISAEFAPFHGWGAGTYASLMSKAMAQAGHEVHVLTWDQAILDKATALRPGVQFHAIRWDRAPTNLAGYPSHPVRHAMGVYDTLRELHAAHRFEYIEYPDFGGEGHFVGRARRTLGEFADAVIGVRLHASVEWLMHLNRTERVGKDWVYNRHIEAQAIRDADVAIAPSRAMIEVVKRQLGNNLGAPPSRPGRVVRVVHNPFDSSLLGDQSKEPPHPPGSSDTPLILCVGRIAYQKGTHVLIDAALRLLDSGRDLRVRILGGDTPTGPLGSSMLDTLRGMIPPRYADRFDIQDDQHPRHVLLQQIRHASVCVFPSLWENFPYACAEAMASGATVLGSDGGGIPEMIESGVSGLLFRSEDATDCAEKLSRLLDDAPLCTRLAKAAPARIAQLCDPARAVRETIEAVEQSRRSAEQALRPSRIGIPLPPRETSIIIPISHGVDHHAMQITLQSAQQQSSPAREILLIHPSDISASTQAALADLSQLPSSVPISCLSSDAATPGALRNVGVHAAQSRLVLILEPGVRADPALLGTLADALATEPSASFASCLTQSQRPISGDPFGSHLAAGIWIGIDRDALPVMNCAGPSSVLLVRDHVLAAGGFDPSLPIMETWELYCSLAQRGGSGVIVPRFLLHCPLPPPVDPVVHDAIRDAINSRHPNLTTNPGWTIRLMQCDRYSPDVVPYDVIRENLRYRLADRANVMLKSLGIQKFFKRLVLKSVEKAEKSS
jgi:glycosyltransferase involved in cell wall biosynthesis